MIIDLSPDVKKFLLSYNLIQQQTLLAQGELNRIFGILEGEIALQEWFSQVDFETKKSFKWLQVYKRKWQPDAVRPKCPWIHFEYTMSWPDQWVLASVDIELIASASREAVQDLARHLHQALILANHDLLHAQGWRLKFPLEANRMILVNHKIFDGRELTAEWIVNTGKEMLNQLSKIIPIIDLMVDNLFIEKS
jgi:hypothetical protein